MRWKIWGITGVRSMFLDRFIKQEAPRDERPQIFDFCAFELERRSENVEFTQKKNIVYGILACTAFVVVLGWGWWTFICGRAGDCDIRDAVQDIERDSAEIESRIDSARDENQNAREQLDDLDREISRAQERASRLQDQACEREELIGEIRRGNEKCQGLLGDFERTLADVEQQNRQSGTQIGSD